MEPKTLELIAECKRQEESCIHTSTSLFEWMKELRILRIVFVVAPIILGSIASARILVRDPGSDWLIATCALLAGLFPAVYKALDLDINLKTISGSANMFKNLQDRFRQAWRVTAKGPVENFEAEFRQLMDRMDAARAASLPTPERYFKRAQAKIESGHYSFAADQAKEAD